MARAIVELAVVRYPEFNEAIKIDQRDLTPLLVTGEVEGIAGEAAGRNEEPRIIPKNSRPDSTDSNTQLISVLCKQ